MRPLIFLLAIALTALVVFTTVRLRQSAGGDFEVLPRSASKDLPTLWTIPDFTLTQQSGQPFSLADLRGKVWVADFFYTTCPGPCPMLTSELSRVDQALAGSPDVRLVSISTDPEKDTPEVLRAYAAHFKASDRWIFLTGPKPAIYQLANEGFCLSLSEDPEAAEPITHSTKLLLIDRRGTVRGAYEGVGGDPQRLLTDLRRLEKE